MQRSGEYTRGTTLNTEQTQTREDNRVFNLVKGNEIKQTEQYFRYVASQCIGTD